ncbi:DUF3817 domain-containing protein [Adhaeribacter terreus]|uniref:DUF3817 domain-containing protein n=1 Tax=Adhaeribacter terreus TaxID=529703 RepID=A0ABW0EC62_9BACT
MSTALGRLRLIGLLEGLSFIVLLCIAMPLKYYFEQPLAVKYVGWAHGVLFVLYIAAVFQVAVQRRWSFMKGILALVASLVPLGTFAFDRQLVREQREAAYQSKVVA